jgi:hypothetical protein
MWAAALLAMAMAAPRSAARIVTRPAEMQVRGIAVEPVAQRPQIVHKVESQEGTGNSLARMIAVQGVELDDAVVFRPYCQGHMGAAISFRF